MLVRSNMADQVMVAKMVNANGQHCGGISFGPGSVNLTGDFGGDVAHVEIFVALFWLLVIGSESRVRVKWRSPSLGWVKVNVDGFSKVNGLVDGWWNGARLGGELD
ncbi:hypothetical protein Goarm_005968 [Gossypium armourianum]|uniref:Uncharacterized protein n=1 Tax=Gossypium armourianum TaxID=34283 RepID=A0A7J9JHC7_9ROSI|nr:hypothetical protein [Gossypium armourianum]